MTCAIYWGRCSLIGLLIVMFFVVVLVLLFISFPLDGVGWGGEVVLSTCSLHSVRLMPLLYSCVDGKSVHNGMTSFKLLVATDLRDVMNYEIIIRK